MIWYAWICFWAPCCGATAAECGRLLHGMPATKCLQLWTDISCPQGTQQQTHHCCCQSMGQMEGRTDRRTLDCYIDAALHTMLVVSTVQLKYQYTKQYRLILMFNISASSENWTNLILMQFILLHYNQVSGIIKWKKKQKYKLRLK